MLIWIIGFPGSGKSTFGKMLAKAGNFVFADTDNMIESETGHSVSDFFKLYGETQFRKKEHDVLLKLSDHENMVIATGGGTPCFLNNIEILNNTGVTVYLKVSANELTKRLIRAKGKRPLIADKTEAEIADYVLQTLNLREPFYSQAKITAINPSTALILDAVKHLKD